MALPWWLQGAAGAIYQPKDVTGQMAEWEKSVDPYYSAAATRMRRAMEKNLGSQRRYLGENFAARGMYGAGMYGRAQERQGAEAYGQLGQQMGSLEEERMRAAMQRRMGLEDVESQRGYESWTNWQKAIRDYAMRKEDERARARAARSQMWGSAAKAIGSAGAMFIPGAGPAIAAGIQGVPTGQAEEDWYNPEYYA